MKQYTYLVGEHCFSLSLPETLNFSPQLLNPYTPFLYEGEDTSIFNLSIQQVTALPLPDSSYLLKHFNQDEPFLWVYKVKENYYFGFSSTPANTPQCLISHNPNQKANTLYVNNLSYLGFAVNNALMLLYMLYTATLDTLLIHSSVIKKGENGYAFLGKSGTGKSTHSRLWLNHIPQTELLNDDNPVVRVISDKVMIYGSPWSGKTPCYRNESAILKGIVRLSQAPQNEIRLLSGIEAYAALLPSCSSTRWDSHITNGIHQTIEKIISRCKIGYLKCLPNQEAAQICQQTID